MSDNEYTQICFDEKGNWEARQKNTLPITKSPIKSEPPRTQSAAALEVLVGLVGGLLCDHKLEDKEINYLKDWLAENISRNDIYPFNLYISNIKAILRDEIVSADERDHLLRFLRHQAKLEGDEKTKLEIYIPCKYIDDIKKALNLALNGEPKQCLKILNVKVSSKDPATCWMRAALYKMMGDESLSRYHYRRTNVKYEDHANAEDELKIIIERLGFEYSAMLKIVL